VSDDDKLRPDAGISRRTGGVRGGGAMRLGAAAAVATGLMIAAVSVAAAPPDTGPVTNLALPRYVSLNASEINVRRGPGRDYRRDWVYRRAGLPVRILDEYGQWRLIEDSTGEGGWVYHALISGRRMAEVTVEGVLLRPAPGTAPGIGACADMVGEEGAGGAVACASRGVLGRLLACRPDWCRIAAGGHEGWVPKVALWGVDPGEIFGE